MGIFTMRRRGVELGKDYIIIIPKSKYQNVFKTFKQLLCIK
jgi:hypothetical protein